jgi:hypothetical protein
VEHLEHLTALKKLRSVHVGRISRKESLERFAHQHFPHLFLSSEKAENLGEFKYLNP